MLVAILDAFPELGVRPETMPQIDDTDLLGRVLAQTVTGGKALESVQIIRDTATAAHENYVTSLNGHRPKDGRHLYDCAGNLDDMQVDHGLFVAGIVQSIAPQAKLCLIRVLNEYGVGDVLGLSEGLLQAQALADALELKLIINCSLALAIPPGEETLRTQILMVCPDPLAETLRLIHANVDGDRDPRCVVVSAAGNDSCELPQNAHRRPSYPASFPTVVGVAALDRNGAEVAYSNRADTDLTGPDLRTSGVATFGGEANSDTGGVRGLYLSDPYPDGTQNTSRWAVWAGTSFATPIVSGLIARGLLSGTPLNTVLHRIHHQAIPPQELAPDTGVGEALRVWQGLPLPDDVNEGDEAPL